MISPLTHLLHVAGAFFTTYEYAKSTFTFLPIAAPIAHSGASAVAECVSCAILTPAEVIKQNAQMVSQASIRESRRSATRQVIERFRRNPLALWRGYGALTTRNLPFTALQFPMFEKAKSMMTHRYNKRKGRESSAAISLWERGFITATAAGSAGAVSAVLTTPIDVVKTRIMLAAAQGFAKQDVTGRVGTAIAEGRVSDAVSALRDEVSKTRGRSHDGSSADGHERYPRRGPEEASKTVRAQAVQPRMSSMSIARDIVKEQGWKGLWRGGALRGGWTMLGSGLYLGVYESGRAYLEQQRAAQEDGA